MKTPAEKRAKKAMLKEKLKARKIGNVYGWSEEEYDWGDGKKAPTGELELFKKIAEEIAYGSGYVIARHIDKEGKEVQKAIRLDDLTVSNMSHKIPKSRGEKYRLDPDNIEIVSVAWHHYEHTRQILQTDLPN